MSAAERPVWLSGDTSLRTSDPARDEQDRADGAALRRLREALPEGWRDPLITTQYARIGGEMEWSISVQDADATGCFFHQFGPTIAAAADQCREALGKP